MKDISTIDPMLDDIGTMIDQALASPDRAEEMKARIRERLARRVHLQQPMPSQEDTSDEEPDDFWENVPI